MNMQKTILIIDDDPFVIDAMSAVLETAGYLIHSAHDGQIATEILSQENVDLIVVDLMMPIMDGLAFLRWLRKDAGLTIPALVQTAMYRPETESLVMLAGANGIIYKPCIARELVTSVRELETLLN